MKEISIVATPIYEFDLDDSSIIDQILSEVKSLKFVQNESNSYSESMYYNEKLFAWFDLCLEELRKKYYTDSIKLEISSCWANKNTRMSKHHSHLHPNSLVSGCFYLTSHASGNIEFVTVNPWITQFQTFQINSVHTLTCSDQDHFLKSRVVPEKGKLILFPSNLIHRVLPLLPMEKEDRYSLAFNVFPSGVLGHGNNSAYLNMQVTPVRDLIGKS